MKKFLKDMFSNSNNISSNRIAFYIVLIYVIVMSSVHWNTLTPEQIIFLKSIFYVSAGLMGMKLIREGFGGNDDEPK